MVIGSSRITQMALISAIMTGSQRIVGRTKIQKIAYLVNICGWNVFTDFEYHYYGPYSETLSSELVSLVENKWVRERQEITEQGNSLYIYSLDRDNTNRLETLIERARRQDELVVEKTLGLIGQLEDLSSDDLEIMATLVFIRRDEGIDNDDKLVQRVVELKDKFSEDRIRSNLKIFKILKPFMDKN